MGEWVEMSDVDARGVKCLISCKTLSDVGLEVRFFTGFFDVVFSATRKPSKNSEQIRMRAHHSKAEGQGVCDKAPQDKPL